MLSQYDSVLKEKLANCGQFVQGALDGPLDAP
jgi:hypothetical protein